MLHGMARVDVPAWQYELTRTSYYAPELGAHHALDLEFMFQRIAPERPRADHDLADAMFGYWLNFVRTHDPNGPGGSALPAWPTFAADEERYLELDAELRVRAALHKERCDALARLTAE